MRTLSKFYDKCKKLNLDIDKLKSELAEMKKKRLFWEEYDAIKERISWIYKRIKGIKKSTYYHTINKIIKNYENIICEELSLKNKRRKIKENGEKKTNNKLEKNLNKILTVMSSK